MRKVVLITGGSRGIGYGIAQALAARSFDVAINGTRPEPEVKDTLKKLGAYGVEAVYCRGDISTAAGRDAVVKKVQDHFGRLHILVNNAGVAPKERKDILEATEESFEYVMKTNLQGPYFLTQAVANWMIQQKRDAAAFDACIINISSISATVASVNRGEYCMAKAGLSMSTQLWAVRLGEFNIPVYEVRPGIIFTDMTSGVKEKYDRLIAEGLTIQKRWGLPGDVGKAVVAIAEGYLPYSTGHVLMVDGGMNIARL
jgi:3-oxoacyl-[acyl-carrier protein] reductase